MSLGFLFCLYSWSVDIFKFLFRKREWVKLCIILATQSIKARAQQEGCRQACTIRLSINEDTKLEKGKEKKGSAARAFIQSSSHVSSRDCVYHNVYHNPPFSTSAVTLPPPPKKPALRLCPYYVRRVFLSLCSIGGLSSSLYQHSIHSSRYFGGLGLLGYWL